MATHNRFNMFEIKWNESGFRPPLCTYRLNWARRTSWGWWDDWDDTVLQTQDSKFEPWRSEAEHATSRSRRLLTILTFTRGWGRNNFVSLKPPRPGTEPRTLAWKAAVLTTTLGPPPLTCLRVHIIYRYFARSFQLTELTTLDAALAKSSRHRVNAGLLQDQRRSREVGILSAKLYQYWTIVCDPSPMLIQHWTHVLYLLGIHDCLDLLVNTCCLRYQQTIRSLAPGWLWLWAFYKSNI